MSDSLILRFNRAEELHIIDPDDVPHFDDLPPLLEIAAAIIIEGYKGVAIDEIKLSNGRFFQAVDVNLGTPEGAILQHLQQIVDAGGVLPAPDLVVRAIREHYGRTAGGDGLAMEGEAV